MDTLSPEKRSKIMSAIRSKDTKAELLVRRYLWAHGIRYHIHRKDLPGKPDITITKYKLAIFIHGCFWHGHDCARGKLPKTKLDYWQPKIEANRVRDAQAEKELNNRDWAVVVIWGCQLRTKKAISTVLGNLVDTITKIKQSHIYV